MSGGCNNPLHQEQNDAADLHLAVCPLIPMSMDEPRHVLLLAQNARKRIEPAFASEPMPTADTLTDVIDGNVHFIALNAVRGERWQELNESDVRSFAVGQFTHAAYRYYIQALMFRRERRSVLGVPPAEAGLLGWVSVIAWRIGIIPAFLDTCRPDQIDAICSYIHVHVVWDKYNLRELNPEPWIERCGC